MVIYATIDDLAAWTLDVVPDNASLLLRSASAMVRAATRCDYYNADAVTFLPTDTAVIAAFRDATTAQAAMWIKAGIDPTGGVASVLGTLGSLTSSSGIGSGKVTYDSSAVTSAANVAALQDAALILCSEAYEVLLDAGFCQNGPWMIG